MSDRTAQVSIQVNGESEALTCTTLAALLDQKQITGAIRGVAVAVNGAVVPRDAWPRTRLAAGDQVEIVRVRQGG